MKILAPVALAALVASSATAQYNDRIVIRDNEVIPVKFEQAVSAKSARRGDRISAMVDGDRYLPQGTRLLGRVVEVQRKDGDRKAFAELEFNEIELPNGQRVRADAYPVPINDRSVSRDRNGRMEAKKGTRRENVVLGSTVGGLILGSLIKKPFEGAIIGALGGILVAETDALNTNGELIVDKGQRMGAAFDREVVIDWRDRDYRYDSDRDRDWDRDRDDWDRNDRDQDDRNRRDDRDDYDRYEDRNGRNDIVIEFNRRELRYDRDQVPYRIGSTTMVPLGITASQLDLEVSRTSGGVFYVEDEDNTVRLEQNKSEMRLNGKRVNLTRAITERDGLTYVPIEVFAAIKRDSLYVNGTRVVART